jgi:ATP-dependent exoDNAse (exonuclease V) alpha subunit
MVHRALASPAIVPIGDPAEQPPIHAHNRAVPDDRRQRYTSRTLLAIEQQLLDQLAAGVASASGILDPGTTRIAIAASILGPDQANAIRVLASAGDWVAVMVGRAGTGKTHTLGTLRTVYEQSGYTVIGLAPSARAARELELGSSIGSTTIARHLVEHREIDASTVVVVDEAGMAGVRDIATIIDQATRVGAKVVLVGDHHQLPEVGAGGAFRAALDTLGARVVELTVNRRQQHLWDQAALDQLRHGDVNTAFAAYLEHDRVVLTDNPDQLHTRAITDWQRLRTSGETLMLAGTRAEAHLLNQLARQLLADTGELDLAHEFEIGGRTYAPGDHVVLCRNHPGQHLQNGERFAVENGMLATIVDIDDNGVHVLLATGERVVLDRNYVERGWVDHAYALTIHKAQGVTCDHVLLVGPAGLYREGIYVALSRARHSAWIYTTSAQVVELD